VIARLLIVCLMAVFLLGCEGIERRNIETLATVISATSKAARPMSESEEYYVGRAVAARILSTYNILEDRRLTDYVNLVGHSVALHSERPQTYGGYHFAVLDADEINAFACPGGTIFITRGMLRETSNEEELAAVLAHEVSHINRRHGVAVIKSARWTEAAGIIGATAARQYGSRDLAKLVDLFEGSIDDVFKTLVVNGYGRSQELEADRGALSYLRSSGYSPEGLLSFLEKLDKKQRDARGGGMLSTHPGTGERISEARRGMPASATGRELINRRARRFASNVRL
jgi:predicted Zn-dependent protease